MAMSLTKTWLRLQNFTDLHHTAIKFEDDINFLV